MTNVTLFPGAVPGLPEDTLDLVALEFDACDVSDLLRAVNSEWSATMTFRARTGLHVMKKSKRDLVEMAKKDPETTAKIIEEIDALAEVLEGAQGLARAARFRLLSAQATAESRKN